MEFQRNKLEMKVQDVTEQSIEWLEGEFRTILESNQSFESKCDKIGFAMLSLENKIKFIDEEISNLKSYKLKLQSAKKLSSELGAKVLHSYGISKLDGCAISSITTTNPLVSTKLHINSINEEEFIKQGFYEKVLDKKKILKAYQDGEYVEFINQHANIVTLETITPSRMRINTRRISKQLDDVA